MTFAHPRKLVAPTASPTRSLTMLAALLAATLSLVVLASGGLVPAQAAQPAVAAQLTTSAQLASTQLANSAPTIVSRGSDNTVAWTLDSEGILTFGAGTFAEESNHWNRFWKANAAAVKKIVFAQPSTTYLPQDSSYFFSGPAPRASDSRPRTTKHEQRDKHVVNVPHPIPWP